MLFVFIDAVNFHNVWSAILLFFQRKRPLQSPILFLVFVFSMQNAENTTSTAKTSNYVSNASFWNLIINFSTYLSGSIVLFVANFYWMANKTPSGRHHAQIAQRVGPPFFGLFVDDILCTRLLEMKCVCKLLINVGDKDKVECTQRPKTHISIYVRTAVKNTKYKCLALIEAATHAVNKKKKNDEKIIWWILFCSHPIADVHGRWFVVFVCCQTHLNWNSDTFDRSPSNGIGSEKNNTLFCWVCALFMEIAAAAEFLINFLFISDARKHFLVDI